MIDGKVYGYFLLGQNPAVGSAHGRLQRLGMANLDWLVVRDLVDDRERDVLEGLARRSRPARSCPEKCRTEVFFFPAASHVEKEGTFTQTQRMLQWREKAVEPPGDAALGAVVLLPPGPDAPGAAGRLDRRARPAAARPGLGLPDARRRRRAAAPRRCCGEINGYDLATGNGRRQLPRAEGRRLHRRAAAGSTPASTPTASTRPPGASRTAEQGPYDARVGLGLADEPAHALQPRLGRPGGQAVERAQEATSGGTRSKGEWTGHDVPDFEKTKPPAYRPPEGAVGRRGAARRRPVHHAGRRQGLAVRAERPARRPAADALRAARVAGPQPAVRPAGQPDAQGLRAGGQPVEPVPAGGAQRGLPVRVHHGAADRAPHGGRDEPPAAVPVRAAAGDVRRGLPRAGRASAGWTHLGWATWSPAARRSRRGCW